MRLTVRSGRAAFLPGRDNRWGRGRGTRVLNNFLVCRVSTINAVVYCLANHSESVTPFPPALTRRLRSSSPPLPSPTTFSSRAFVHHSLAGDSTLPYASPSRSITFVCRSEGRMKLFENSFENNVCQCDEGRGGGVVKRAHTICTQSWGPKFLLLTF